MVFSNETTALLKGGLPFHERQGPKGVKFKYVKTEDVIQRLNDAFGHAWSSTVVSTETSGDFVVVLIRLSSGDTCKEAYGGAQLIRSRKDNSIMDLGNAYKSAFANALKGAAKQFGVGLDEDADVAPAPKPYNKPSSYSKPVPRPSASEPTPAPAMSANARGTEVSAAASTSIKVGKPSTTSNDMLEKARAMLAKGKEEAVTPAAAPVETPAPTPTLETPFPSNNTAEGNATDIQITAIQKLCARANKSEEEILNDARSSGVIKSAVTTADKLKKNEGAAMIRFLTHKKAGNA